MKIKFWGTRGSLPYSFTGSEVFDKVVNALRRFNNQPRKRLKTEQEAIEWVDNNLDFIEKSTYGGYTTCVEIRCGEIIIVIDMGSGLRRFGDYIAEEMRNNKGLVINFLVSHVHPDHTQGMPYFAPIYWTNKAIKNAFNFYGKEGLEKVLKEQVMAHPVFPVEWETIRQEGPMMRFVSVHDGFEWQIRQNNDIVSCKAKKLNHPDEVYGYRIEYNGKVFVFASDTEPFRGEHKALTELALNADALYLDCQYDKEEYFGENGSSRQGFGHGYDDWAVEVAKRAKVKSLILGHHDPSHSDEQIEKILKRVKFGCSLISSVSQPILVESAHDDMTLFL